MERVISQCGDSTDGEDFEIKLGTDNFVEEKLNQRHNSGNCTIFFQGEDGKEFFNISTSCILRIIGHELLQSEEVRKEYKKIKSSFIPEDLKIECEELDKLLGRKWSEIVINNVYRHKHNWSIDIYQILKEDLDKFFRESIIFNEFCSVNAEVKAEYNEIREIFLSEGNPSKSVEKLLNRIQSVNKKISEFNQSRREITELLILRPDKTEANACASLARLKASLKLDRDLEKNYVYDCRMPGLTETSSKSEIRTQNNETLFVKDSGTFRYYKNTLSTYEYEGKKLLEFEQFKKINKNEIKNFFKKVLRGNLDKSILTNENDKETLDRLKDVAELMFGIESKRNFAALLNNAMFLDLVHAEAESYAINNISAKMPMAMRGAVVATAVIDKHVERRYLTDYPPQHWTEPYFDVLTLARREQQITQDWIKFKLNKTDPDFEENVPASIFNELILDWYGIELPFLKKGMIKFEPLSHGVEKKPEKPQITNEISIDKEKAESTNSANTFKDIPSNQESPEKAIKENGEVSVNAEPKNLEDNKCPEVETETPIKFLPNNESPVSKISEAAIIKNCENDLNHNVIVVEGPDEKQEGKNIAKKRSGPEFCPHIMSPEDSPKKLAVDNLSSIDQDEIDKNSEKIVLSLTL